MTIGYLVVALLLLLANGFFVAAEFSLMAVRRTQVQHLATKGNPRAAMALKSIRELSLMLAAAQLGITMASLGLGYVAEPAVAHLFEDALGYVGDLPEALVHGIAFVIALAIVSFLHMVIGEMAPKNIAIARPEETALHLAVPFRLFANVFRPVIFALNAVANGILKLMGVEPKQEIETIHTAAEIGRLVAASAAGGKLREVEHRLLSGVLAFGELGAGAVMVPRTEMVAVPRTTTPEQVEQLTIESGHSRFPLYEKNLDHVVGFFHTKDLLRIPDRGRSAPLPRRLIRPLLVVPESRKLHPLLLDMKREREHFALVVDEHGGTAGIVTLEDILEELVGEIMDEHDEDEAGIKRVGRDRFLVPGNLRIDEIEDRLGVKLPEGDYETLAGFLMDRLGRIPTRRDSVRHEDWVVTVRSMQQRRVAQVLLAKVPQAVPSEAAVSS